MCTDAPEQDTETQEAYADMLNWMYSDWETRFQPIEQELLDEVMNRDENIRQNVETAGAEANKSYEATMGISERNMARYGTEMDADQRAATDLSNDISQQGSQISAQGMARDASTARYDQLATGMMGVGSGVKTGAISGMGTAANMEAQRNNYNQNAYAQSQAQFWNTLGGAASTGAMIYMASDKNRKTNVRKASTKEALRDIEAVDLKHYDYKPGMSGGRPEKGHIGGMAQDMPDSMTSEDKTMVDIGDSLMTLVGATQALSQRIKALEKRNGS